MQGNAVAYPITINFQVYIQRVLEELLALQGRACFIQSPKRISHPSAETCRLPAALSHLFKHNYISTMFIQQTPRHQPGRSCGSKVYPLVFLLNSRNISSSIHDSQDTCTPALISAHAVHVLQREKQRTNCPKINGTFASIQAFDIESSSYSLHLDLIS